MRMQGEQRLRRGDQRERHRQDSISKNGIYIFDGCPTGRRTAMGSWPAGQRRPGNTSSGNAGPASSCRGTVIGNTADEMASGLTVGSSVIVGNTAIGNATNLVQQGPGCTAANNAAP
jgi:hypothetical protein